MDEHIDPDSVRDFDRVRAIFRPLRTDDLKPGVADWIGREMVMQAHGYVEHGPYEGQRSFNTDWGDPADRPPFIWAPACDLEILEVIAC